MRIRFFIERMVLRGAKYQLLFLAVTIILVSVVGGGVVYIFTGDFKGMHNAVWWAFLRLTDPGYLGDDQGLFMRVVSVTLMILGYILFWGALVAIMTQWLYRTLRSLEQGTTPITRKGHMLILGWSNRTIGMVREIMSASGWIAGTSSDIGVEDLHIVILAEEVTSDLAQELRQGLGSLWDEKRILLRTGSPLRMEHLQRVDYTHAGVIIVPGHDFSTAGWENLDTRAIKTLFYLSKYGGDQKTDFPLVISEISDERKVPVVLSAYKGEIELISSDQVISRLIVQSIRHNGLLDVVNEIMNQNEGNDFFLREFPQLHGKRLQDLSRAFPRAIVAGVLRKSGEGQVPILNPPDGFRVQAGDRLAILARENKDTDLSADFEKEPVKKGIPQAISPRTGKKRVLILGWNHNIPAVLNEFDSYEGEHFVIDNLSMTPVSEREDLISRFGPDFKNVELRHLRGDYTVLPELENVSPGSYDNIVLVSDSRLKTHEESDAISILGFLTLKEKLQSNSQGPEILIQLMDPQNKKLFLEGAGTVLVSPLILNQFVARVALRRDLKLIFSEIFTTGGAEIDFRPWQWYGMGKEKMSFREIKKAVAMKGDLALGVKTHGESGTAMKRTHLNPAQDSLWNLQDNDEIIVLTTVA
ncbi:hypothetical protein ACFL4N_01865 [Thermodesulfobacteriota bacterium]